MLIHFLLQLLVSIVNVMVFWLPEVSSLNISSIFWIPIGITLPIDDYLTTGFGYVYFLAGIIPPLAILLKGFTVVVLWRSTLLTLRVFRIFR